MAGLGFSNTEFSAMLNVPAEPEEEKVDGVTPNKEPEIEDRVKPSLPTPDINKMGTWQKHTKGFGMKMLSKMGFKGRLGKDEQGVAAPVAVKARPNQMGLGFGDFKEAVTLKQNKEIERDLHGKSADDETHEIPEHLKDEGTWRKRITGSKKRKRKTVEDILDDERSAIDLVVDMRGPLAQIYTNGVESVPIQTLQSKPYLGQEILYNLRHVINETEGTIRSLNSKITNDRSRLNALQTAHAHDKSKIDSTKELESNISHMIDSLEHMQKTLPVKPEEAIDVIVTTVASLFASYPSEFEAHHVIDVIPSLTIPLLKCQVQLWQPLELDENGFHLRALMIRIKDCLTTSIKLTDEHEVSVFATNIGSATRHEKIYDYISKQVILPRVITSIHQWKVISPCLEAIEFLETFLSPTLINGILHENILPKLQHHVRHCHGVSEVEHIHTWLTPWYGHFKETFVNEIYPVIRETLARTLINWHPNDTSIFPVLLPWKEVWQPEEFAIFTHKHIIKKLIRVLNREFEINPKNQQLEPLEWVLAWHHILPDRQFIALLEAEFFTKWLKVLSEWISQNPSNAVDEIIGWYNGWKHFFGEIDLLHEERICMQFFGALQLMQCIQQTNTLPQLKLLPHRYEDALLRGKKRSAPIHPKHELHRVNMRDVVEEYAQQHNIEFAPRHKNQDGQQVYGFGKQHIILDHGLVYVETSKGRFDPLDIEELVKRA